MGNGPPTTWWHLPGFPMKIFHWLSFWGEVTSDGTLTLISLAWFCLSSEAHGSCNISREWIKSPQTKIAIQISLPKKLPRKKLFVKKRGFPRLFCCTSLKVWHLVFNQISRTSHQPTPFKPTPHITPQPPAIRRRTKKIHPHKMVHKQSTDGEDADTYLHMVLDLSNPENTPLED